MVQLFVAAGAALTEKQLVREANAAPDPGKMKVVLKPVINRIRGIDPLVLPSIERILQAGTSLPVSVDRDRILTAAKWMAGKAPESTGITGSYRQELEASASRLESLRATAEAGAVADDLELKVAHCKALGIGMGGKVRVSVTTRRGSQVVNNWQVLYLRGSLRTHREWLRD